MRMRTRLNRGFTLIELLIVVAIIAILAAIAVPNFLEAQTRSKVSRVLADMRTMGTALEAYRVDGVAYPPDWHSGTQFYSFIQRLALLTTPVAYLTSLPEDVFAANAIEIDPIYDDAYRVPSGTGPLVRPFVFDYANRKNPDGRYDPVESWSWISRSPGNLEWAMRSVGPDRKGTYLGTIGATVYDPTNGTVSAGDIFYTGPGTGVDKP